MSRPGRSATEIGLLLGINGLAGLLLLGSTLLRETPEFWRNSGGYPVLLRDVVFILHYPLFLGVMSGTLLGTLMTLRLLASRRSGGLALLFLVACQWVLLLGVLVIMLWNNVDNVLHGRPLHYHPGE